MASQIITNGNQQTDVHLNLQDLNHAKKAPEGKNFEAELRNEIESDNGSELPTRHATGLIFYETNWSICV